MVESCVKISASIKNEHRDFLKKKKEENPRDYPGDSFFIKKGLDYVIYGDRSKILENVIVSVLSLMIGFLGLSFGIIILVLFVRFNPVIYMIGFLVIGVSGMVMVLSSIRFKRVYKIWKV